MLSKLNGTLHTNFKEEFRWWSSIELARRFVFLLFFMPFPRSTVSSNYVCSLKVMIIAASVEFFLELEQFSYAIMPFCRLVR